MKLSKLCARLSVLVLMACALPSFGAQYMSSADIQTSLLSQGLSPAEVSQVMTGLQRVSFESMPITGYLFAQGFNGALLLDTDDWDFSVSFVSPTGKIARLHDFAKARFSNGGFVFELSYKWVFAFLTGGLDVRSLDGAVCGRGLGAIVDPLIGIDVAMMPCQNRPGSIIMIAPMIGFGGGLRFPKMTFQTKPIR